jgi:hypothetical protein
MIFVLIGLVWMISGFVGMYIGHYHVDTVYDDTSVGAVLVGTLLGLLTLALVIFVIVQDNLTPILRRPFFKGNL